MGNEQNNGGANGYNGGTNDGGKIDARGLLVFDFLLSKKRGIDIARTGIESLFDRVCKDGVVDMLRMLAIALLAVNFFEFF